MRHARVTAVAVSLFVLATNARAVNHYVATNGNDANAGSLAAPFRTITKAAKVAKPGDVVNVRAGTYSDIVYILSKGTPSAWITFQPYGNETVVLDGTGSAADTTLVQIYEAQYVEVRGFEIRNATKSGLHAYASDHIRIVGNTTHHNQRNGISVSTVAGDVAADFTISGNTVHDNNLENRFHTASSGWGQGIGVFRGDGATITDNKVYRNHGEGIDFILTDNGVARGNEVFDNYGINIYLDNAQNITVDANLLYTTYDTAYYRHSAPAHGVAVANEIYEYANLSSHLTITNNVIIGGRTGFYHGNYDRNAGLANTVVANNTFYGAAWTLVRLDTAAHTNTEFVNNVFVQTGGGSMVESDFDGGVTFRSNNWYGGTPGQAATPNDFVGDPRLVRPGSNRAPDYQLTAQSPLIGLGADLSSIVSSDYFGNVRRAGSFDIGAHQLSGTTTLDRTPPTVPGNLRATGGSTNRVDLTWDASTDDVGVTGYVVSRNGQAVATVQGRTWSDTSVDEQILYDYEVRAVDAAGNQSAASNVLSIAWSSNPTEGDAVAPTAPAALRSGAITSRSLSLSWTASTDNVAVTDYEIYRNGVRIATVHTHQWLDASVASSTTYQYQVLARDAAGNRSAGSNTLRVTTPSGGRRRTTRP
ncbi:MAG: right-handed parallel beta-helix repeat-containing protein [Thermoanaerobaculia bacterium]